jgi:hypothetical protein
MARISKADKGNSIVIMYDKDYNDKIQEYIQKNNFTILNKNPTTTFQNKIKATLKNCHTIIHKDNKFKLTNMNPTAPNITGLAKVHKKDCPIRPIINWQGAPAYKMAKHLSKLIQLHIPLPNAFNINNSAQIIEDLSDIPYRQGLRLVSFDIENTYPNIPSKEIIHIIEKMAKANQLDNMTTKELTAITRTVIEQNYFTFQNKYYYQNNGLAMGAPSSAILSEIYLQHLDHTEIINIIIRHNITGYFRYVDDILMVYDEEQRDINEVHTAFNKLAPTIKFTIETENDNAINFLDEFSSSLRRVNTYRSQQRKRERVLHSAARLNFSYLYSLPRISVHIVTPINQRKGTGVPPMIAKWIHRTALPHINISTYCLCITNLQLRSSCNHINN